MSINNVGRNGVMINGDSRLEAGRRITILGYAKTANEYYVKVEDGNICHYVKADNIKLDE